MGPRIGLRVAVLAGLLGSLVPTAAHTAFSCTFDLATHTITIPPGGVALNRNGNEIVAAPYGACVDGSTAATIFNTDLIIIDSDGADTVIITLGNGPFAPGFTNEPGSSDEIEISVRDGIGLEIDGSSGSDSIVGGTEGFNLNAAEPDDDVDVLGVIYASAPDLYGGEGNDLLSLRGGSGTGGDAPTVGGFQGNPGNDSLLASRSSVVEGDTFPPLMSGGTGNDRLEGGPFDDGMLGDEDDDVLDGFGGDDTLHGGPGLDTASFASETGAVSVDLSSDAASDGSTLMEIENATGGPFNDEIFGDLSTNILRGGAGNDELNGLSGADELFGDVGNDNLLGFAGGEALNGGSGSDTAEFDAPVMSSINLVTGSAIGDAGSATLASIENTSALSSSVTVVGTSGPNRIHIKTGTADVTAGGGPDHVITDSGNDTIRGQDGNDLLEPGGGANNLTGGAGNDVMKLADGDNEILNGGTGRDRTDFSALFSSMAIDLELTTPQVTGSGTRTFIGIEDVVGTRGHDTIRGNGGANSLSGARGDDVLQGGGGNDTITGNVGEDQLFGGPGLDSVSFATAPGGVRADLAISKQQDTNYGYDTMTQFENIIGSPFADFLFGNAAANRLLGGGGNDRLTGRAGNDFLDGGAGADSCDGGPGVDKLLSC